jgi:hypothetical protein
MFDVENFGDQSSERGSWPLVRRESVVGNEIRAGWRLKPRSLSTIV